MELIKQMTDEQLIEFEKELTAQLQAIEVEKWRRDCEKIKEIDRRYGNGRNR